MIESVVKLWLQNSNFLDKFKEYYDVHHDNCGKEQHDVEYIRNELDYIGRSCSDTDDPDTYFVDNGMEHVNIRSRNMFRAGYYITANCADFSAFPRSWHSITSPYIIALLLTYAKKYVTIKMRKGSFAYELLNIYACLE